MGTVLFTCTPRTVILKNNVMSTFPFFGGTVRRAVRDFPCGVVSSGIDIITSRRGSSDLLNTTTLLRWWSLCNLVRGGGCFTIVLFCTWVEAIERLFLLWWLYGSTF